MNELVKIENNEIILDKQYVEEYRNALKIIKKWELGNKEVLQAIKDYMESTGKTEPIKLDGLEFNYRKGTTRTTIDSKRLKEECSDIYEEYSKTSLVSSSVSVKIVE